MSVILSTFTGGGLLDRGFSDEGFCVVSAGDILWGHDISRFTAARHIFTGVIGGPPCPDFSKALRTAPTGNGLRNVAQFARVVTEAQPVWFLMENVPGVPDIAVDGYTVQRFNLNASECGVRQNRLRCFQFGSKTGLPLVIHRGERISGASPCCMASEGKRGGGGGHGRNSASFKACRPITICRACPSPCVTKSSATAFLCQWRVSWRPLSGPGPSHLPMPSLKSVRVTVAAPCVLVRHWPRRLVANECSGGVTLPACHVLGLSQPARHFPFSLSRRIHWRAKPQHNAIIQ